MSAPEHSIALAHPPRGVPLSLRLRLLIGGFSNQFGWFFLGFGLVFARIFLPLCDFDSLRFLGELELAPGTVLACEATGASEGGSDTSDGDPVFRCTYSFTGPEGEERRGASFGSRTRTEGAAVTVEYPRGTPDVSRIRGMRSGVFPLWTLFVLVFPAIGLIFVSFGLRNGLRAIRLLARGRPARGKLVEKRATNTSINDRTVYALTFEFHDGLIRRRMTAKTHLTARVEDEEEEDLLFDAWKPSNAVLLDNLPARPEIDERGGFRSLPSHRVLLTLLVPGLFVAGHVVWLVVAAFVGS